LIPAVNFHLYKPCNLRCRFCFATFRDIRGRIPRLDVSRILGVLRSAGCEKINFAGGEPTLYPDFGSVLSEARALGFVTSIVTNGARLRPLLQSQPGDLDWVGLSIDSGSEVTQAALGRGRGRYVATSVALAQLAHTQGVKVKLNSVITRLNVGEDLSGLVRRVRPLRWKVFQVLAVAGQNDGKIDDLLISGAAFAGFVDRHAHLAAEGFAPVVEDNDAMRGSYVMIDPRGRFFCNTTGGHRYSRPILEVGVFAALGEVGFQLEKFDARGGRYAW